MRVIAAHNGPVRCLAYSPDGTLLASGGDDATIKLWHNACAEQPTLVRRHGDWVRGLAFTKDGSRLASGGWEGVVVVGRVRPLVPGHHSHGNHPGGGVAAAFAAAGQPR